jgi:sulfite reductase alpha subunit-like flavoprotein
MRKRSGDGMLMHRYLSLLLLIQSFYRFLLRRDLPSSSLSLLSYSVFGLGDSSYPLFNAIARRLNQRLKELGGREIVERGLGDDQAERGVEEALDPWLDTLWKKLAETDPLPQGFEEKGKVQEEMRWKVEIIRNSTSSLPPSTYTPFPSSPSPYLPIPLRLAVNKRFTPDIHFQDVRHLELEIPKTEGGDVASPSSSSSSTSSSFLHTPGDVLLIHPRNVLSPELRGWIEKTWQVDLEKAWVKVESLDPSDPSPPPFPPSFSLFDCFTLHLDWLGTPRRFFFEQLAFDSKSEMEREKLNDFCDARYYADFARYCVKEKRTYLEALSDFPNSIPPLEDLIGRGMIPRLQARSFSIASSSLAFPTRLHILLAILSIKTPFNRLRTGVCSAYLAQVKQGEEVYCYIKKPLPGALPFRAPPPEVPLICIGPGTGLAPFRAIVQERREKRRRREDEMGEREPEIGEAGEKEVEWPPILLFFGNRNRSCDFFYQAEFSECQRERVLDLEAVFSRDARDERGVEGEDRWRFVQHLMLQKRSSDLSCLILSHNASIMIAGSAGAMPKDVRTAVVAILAEEGRKEAGGKWGEERAQEYVKMMEKTRRYQVEAW